MASLPLRKQKVQVDSFEAMFSVRIEDDFGSQLPKIALNEAKFLSVSVSCVFQLTECQ